MIQPIAFIKAPEISLLRQGLSDGFQLGYDTKNETFSIETKEGVTYEVDNVARKLFEKVFFFKELHAPDFLHLVQKRFPTQLEKMKPFFCLVQERLEWLFRKPIPIPDTKFQITFSIIRLEDEISTPHIVTHRDPFHVVIKLNPEIFNMYGLFFKWNHSLFRFSVPLQGQPVEVLTDIIMDFYRSRPLEEELNKECVVYQQRVSILPYALAKEMYNLAAKSRSEKHHFCLHLNKNTNFLFYGDDLTVIKKEMSAFLKMRFSPEVIKLIDRFSCHFVQGKPTVDDFAAHPLVLTMVNNAPYMHYQEGNHILSKTLLYDGEISVSTLRFFDAYIQIFFLNKEIPKPYYFEFALEGTKTIGNDDFKAPYEKFIIQTWSLAEKYQVYYPDAIKSGYWIFAEYDKKELSIIPGHVQLINVCRQLNSCQLPFEVKFEPKFPQNNRESSNGTFPVEYEKGTFKFTTSTESTQISCDAPFVTIKEKVFGFIKKDPAMKFAQLEQLVSSKQFVLSNQDWLEAKRLQKNEISYVTHRESGVISGWNLSHIIPYIDKTFNVKIETFDEDLLMLKRLLEARVLSESISKATAFKVIPLIDKKDVEILSKLSSDHAVVLCTKDNRTLFFKNEFKKNTKGFPLKALDELSPVKFFYDAFEHHLRDEVEAAGGVFQIGTSVDPKQILKTSLTKFLLDKEGNSINLYCFDCIERFWQGSFPLSDVAEKIAWICRNDLLKKELKAYPPQENDYIFTDEEELTRNTVPYAIETVYITTGIDCQYLKWFVLDPIKREKISGIWALQEGKLKDLVEQGHEKLAQLREESCLIDRERIRDFYDISSLNDITVSCLIKRMVWDNSKCIPLLKDFVSEIRIVRADFENTLKKQLVQHQLAEDVLKAKMDYAKQLIEGRLDYRVSSYPKHLAWHYELIDAAHKRFQQGVQEKKEAKRRSHKQAPLDEAGIKAEYYTFLIKERERCLLEISNVFKERQEAFIKPLRAAFEEHVMKRLEQLKWMKDGRPTRKALFLLFRHLGFIKRKQ